MGAFLTGLLQGGVDQAKKNKGDDSGDGNGNGKAKGSKLKGLLRKKKKPPVTQGDSYDPLSFKRGGKVKRTGLARVHKGERVLTTKQAQRYRAKRR
jgi:hypothetical protein